MALIEAAKSPQLIPSPDDLADPDFELPRWVNVSIKVGENLRQTKSVDTMWVQFVIDNIFSAPGMFRLVRPLKIDGIYGDDTKAWIKHFQSDETAQTLAQGSPVSFPVRPDGAVNHVPPGEFFTRREFTAYRLNKVLAQLDTLLFVRLTAAAATNASLAAFIKAST